MLFSLKKKIDEEEKKKQTEKIYVDDENSDNVHVVNDVGNKVSEN
jgi:hypothetical protein